MLFNSYIFIFLFLPLALAGYYGLNYLKQYKAGMIWLIGMSMWFYGYNSIQYLFILIISILLNYLIVEIMSHMHGQKSRKLLMISGVLLNIGILFYYKYYDFFIENVNAVCKTDVKLLQVVLPLGISFYTFQQLSYVIDYYRHDCDKYSLLEYAAYVSFFPQLIAGPIVYHDELIPQFRDEERKHLNAENFSKGIYAFVLGFAKKVLIADTFSKIVTIGYQSVGELNSSTIILVMISYSLQIYFDFSGYCDMAYGIGYMFNIELPINFNSPYKAVSIVDFWDRWHMTLTRFFTRYIYIPLGGSRKGKLRTYLNVMIVFFVSGVWHGANWTFILWGVLNGIANIIDKLLDRWTSQIPKAIRVIFTFIVCTFAWSLFRADSIEQARALWRGLFHAGWGSVYTTIVEKFNDIVEMQMLYRIGFSSLIDAYPGFLVFLFALLTMFACFIMRNTQEKVADMQYTNRKIGVIALLFIWSVMSLSEVSEFLYFNF